MTPSHAIPLLIDADGRSWVAGSSELRHHLGFYGTADLVDYALRNLGFVGLRAEGPRVTVTLRPDAFTHASLRRLIELLVGGDAQQIILRLVRNGASAPVEVYHDVEELAARLAILRDIGADAKVERPPLSIVPLSLGRLAGNDRPQQSKLYATWRRRRGILSRRTITTLMADQRGEGGLWVRVTDGDRAIVETWPKYITLYPQDTIERLIGGDVADQPDPQYGAGTGDGFRRVAHRGEPLLELVDAIITPGSDGVRRWSRYDRLLLPWLSESGERWVSSLSSVRRRVVVSPN
jgi:hypothetical protein